MRGTDVRVLQDYLSKVGIKTKVDGQYGPKTRSQVKRWERKSSLPINGRMTRSDAAILRGQVGQGAGALNGGVAPASTLPAAPTSKATLDPDTGLATPPADAPPEVVAAINAANEIVGKPYRYGGGHANWEDSGYDCSGAESYALRGGGFVDDTLTSSGFMSWGEPGEGTWITSYANGGHSFVVIAGLRFDTGYNSGGDGPKWNTKMRPTSGFVVRHPEGF